MLTARETKLAGPGVLQAGARPTTSIKPFGRQGSFARVFQALPATRPLPMRPNSQGATMATIV